MSTNVRIKQKALFKKKLEMKDIVALTGLAYGVIDDNYRLIRNEMAENTLIYDENRLARGIDLWLDGTDILFSLSLPTTRSEIRLFYHVITTICNEVGTKKYIREEDTVSLKDNERFMQYDEEASIGALKDLQEKIGNDEYRRFEIFGVFNPISISLKEIRRLGIIWSSLKNICMRFRRWTYIMRLQMLSDSGRKINRHLCNRGRCTERSANGTVCYNESD